MRNFIRTLLASVIAIGIFGLASPANAADVTDYGYSRDGFVVDRGYTIMVVSPQCASSLLVTFTTGKTEIAPLDTSLTYFPDAGLAVCRTMFYGKYAPSLVASYDLWTDSGNVRIYPIARVQLTNVTATPGDKVLNLSWDAPENPKAIRSYFFWVRNIRTNTVALQAEKKVVGTSTQISVPFNAEDWQVDITPITVVDNGANVSFFAAANKLPSAPSRVTLVPGDHQLELLFSPAAAESAQVTSWTVRLLPTGQVFTLAGYETHAVISEGISNNVSYSATVAGSNVVGTGASTASNAVTPRAVPLAPNGLKVQALGATGARVTWNQSRSDITSYLVTHVPSGQQISVPASNQWAEFSDIRVAGRRVQTNTFTVVAVNDYVSSSPTSTDATLVPTSPANVYLTAGLKSVDVSWTQPADQLSEILNYSLALLGSDGSVKSLSVSGATESVAITGLSPNLSYSATISATNAWGKGQASLQSNTVRAQDVPSKPARTSTKQTVTSQEAGIGLDVILGAVDTNGCNLTNWTVKYNRSDASPEQGQSITQTAQNGLVHLVGLDSDVDYLLEVSATNCWGTSPSNIFTIHTYSKPLPVTSALATIAADGSVIVTWELPDDSKATSLNVTLQPDGTSVQVSTKAKRVIFSEVILGQTYSAVVSTRNSYGSSLAVQTNEVTSETLPGSISGLTITVDTATATAHVRWNPPAASGSQITGYEVWVDGDEHQIVTEGAIDIDGLIEGDIHTFSVFAINHLGNGPTTTETFGLSMPTLEPDNQGSVIVWHLNTSLSSARYVTIQKRSGKSGWKTVAKVKASKRSFTVKSAKKTDVFRVIAKVHKKTVQVKSSVRKIHLKSK